MQTRELIDRYLAWHQANRAPKTSANVRWFLGKFAALFGAIPVSHAKAYMLAEFVDSHPSWGAYTRFHAAAAVNACWRWAVDQEHVDRNPFAKVKYPAPTEGRRAATDEELRAMLKAVPLGIHDGAQTRRVMLALRWLGLRPAELCALRWDDHVDLQAGSITLRRHKTSTRTGKPRVVPLVGRARRLFEWMKQRSTTAHVFVNVQGGPFTTNCLQRRLRRARDRAGVSSDVSLYCLRHSFGSSGAANGVDAFTLATVMGHSRLSTTQRYVHPSAPHLRDAMDKAAGG